ncbi:hypothetical protein [Variovorax gossypii]
MRLFGWKAGVHYCPHLSDATTAWFAGVLGMPWADDGGGMVPPLGQAVCERDFSDWLAPWYNAPVEWVLLARDSSDPTAKWTPVGTSSPVTQGLALTAADRGNLVAQCAARLHAYVRGHTNAMGEEPMGDASPIFSYPIISPGIAHLPAYLSASALGTSALLKVDRAALPPTPDVVAVPIFALSDGAAKPSMDVSPGTLVPYQGPSRTVDQQVYAFHGVHVRSLAATDFQHDASWTNAAHRFLSVRSRTPDRQLYATVSREYSPLRLWLWSVKEVATVAAPGYSGKEFCALLVRLLGAGEDELVGPVSVGSIYEIVLPREVYQALFGASHAERPAAARQMLATFEAWMAGDTDGQRARDLLETFSVNLDKLGLEDNRKRLKERVLAAATDLQPVKADAIAAASEVYASLAQQHAAARAGWAAWLATVLPRVIPASGAGQLVAAIDLILEGARRGMRDATGEGAVVDDDVLRLLNGQIDHSPDFWTIVHDQADDIGASLMAARVPYLDPMIQRVAASQPLVAAKLGDAYDMAKTAVVLATQADDPQADDPPLQMGFRPAGADEAVRGCLLALRLGVPRGASTDWKPGRWITNAWAKPSLGGGTFGPVMKSVDGHNAIFCDTQGATQSDGLDEQVAVYGGVPLLAAEEAASPNPSMPELSRFLPTDVAVPALAYGARYGGFSVTVDNAGAIIEPALRGAHPGEPLASIPAAYFESNGSAQATPPFQYLSRRPPGAPVFVGYDDWGVKQDTLTFCGAAVEPGSHHVAVLFSGDGYRSPQPGKPPSQAQEVELRAPSVGPGFIERWMSADALVGAGDAFRWKRVQALTIDEIKALQADAASNQKLVFTHPAVSAVEIRATWFAGNLKVSDRADTIKWMVEHLRAGHWLQAETLKIRIRQTSSTDPLERKFELDPAGHYLDIVVRRGDQVRLEARSVLPKDLLEGDNARLHKGALVSSDPKVVRPYEPHGAQAYASREAQVLWIESLPEVPVTADLFNFKPEDFRLVKPTSAAMPQEIALELSHASPLSAQWITRVELEHKRWQWSGYPARFPASGALEKWLPLYSGTKDYMPVLPSAGFTTAWNAGKWFLDALVMKPVPLPAIRPANHMGFVVKAVPRFAKLLADTTLARIEYTHVFDHVPGISRLGPRLAAPVWNEAIPMPQTVAVDPSSGKRSQASRGNFLVLSDPVYDTSDTAVFGGIAERLEFDVVATWYMPTLPGSERVLEAGPNPVFHGAPPAAEPQPRFEADTIFGLTYDKAPGGRAAQTAIVLRSSNTQGRWTLAKCRIRRFVLPNLMLDTKLDGTVTAGRWTGGLGLRQVEQGWVPQDFVLYSDQAIASADLSSYPIQFPVVAGNFARAYLVTWHRDRWAQAEPKWRPLVRLYERHADYAEWSIKEQLTPFDAGDFAPLGKGEGSLILKYQGDATPYRIDVSEFAESRWLSFIGSFGREVPAGPEHIEVARSGSGYRVRAMEAGRMPVLGAKDDLRPTLLLIFAPQLDLMRGRVETEGGELVGVYAANQVQGATVTFDEAILPCTRAIDECQALLIQMQHHNVEISEHIIAAGKWAELVGGLFPQEEEQKEATIRFLPEYIGPMRILAQ